MLGLGNIGALAAKPVMEGKALLFKIFAGLDAVDVEIDETDPKRFAAMVKAISPTYGGINLEDIKAPECFEIENELVGSCGIPVMHDDQHGTAVIVGAALLNALHVQDKAIGDVRVVVNGAGAAAIACTRLIVALGVKRENIVMCDSKGAITRSRQGLSAQKAEFATSRTDVHTLADAVAGADVFLGLSVADVLTPAMLASMAPGPVVFALANPNPEIARDTAMATRSDIVYATGRSDYPNQINNVLGFPYIFRAALDCRATVINAEGLETIGRMTFSSCRAIETITIPSTVKAIELMAFYGCTGIKEITSLNTVPPTCATDGMFEDFLTATLHVPATSVDDYKAATSWKEFTNIEGITPTGIDGIENDNVNTGRVYYNLQGIKVSENNITPGIYIIREGAKTTKAHPRHEAHRSQSAEPWARSRASWFCEQALACVNEV